MTIDICGITWTIDVVSPGSPFLIDRTNTRTVATTDPETKAIYISYDLSGDFLMRVLIHEIAHCVLYGCNLLVDIHRMTKRQCWIEMEEFICNIIANYLMEIYVTSNKVSKWYSRSFI